MRGVAATEIPKTNESLDRFSEGIRNNGNMLMTCQFHSLGSGHHTRTLYTICLRLFAKRRDQASNHQTLTGTLPALVKRGGQMLFANIPRPATIRGDPCQGTFTLIGAAVIKPKECV